MDEHLAPPRLDQLPTEMLSFTLSGAIARTVPRLGRLSFPGRKDILTPGFIANTSRGAIPHITPDVQSQHTEVGGVYIPVEDCKPAQQTMYIRF
jgi:queuine tRNA-ribosyltransferase subunit QTRTD1